MLIADYFLFIKFIQNIISNHHYQQEIVRRVSSLHSRPEYRKIQTKFCFLNCSLRALSLTSQHFNVKRGSGYQTGVGNGKEIYTVTISIHYDTSGNLINSNLEELQNNVLTTHYVLENVCASELNLKNILSLIKKPFRTKCTTTQQLNFGFSLFSNKKLTWEINHVQILPRIQVFLWNIIVYLCQTVSTR